MHTLIHITYAAAREIERGKNTFTCSHSVRDECEHNSVATLRLLSAVSTEPGMMINCPCKYRCLCVPVCGVFGLMTRVCGVVFARDREKEEVGRRARHI